jgi:hypothetical protein
MNRAYRRSVREFFPLAGSGKTIKVEQGSAVHDNVADLDHASQTNQVLVVDLVLPEQLGVVPEIAQKPVELPQRSGCAVEASGEAVASEFRRCKDRKAKEIERFSRIPSMVGSLDPN